MSCSKRVIVIGASGLIGKEVLWPLQKFGFEVFTIARNFQERDRRVTQIQGDIFEEAFLEAAFKKAQATHLLNFAWGTTGNYLDSYSNFLFMKAGINILKHFKENGGVKAIFAGTCLEYAPSDNPLLESSLLAPKTVYAQCKNTLRELGEVYCQKNKIDFGWGRIFYAYGHGENVKRLTPYIINSLNMNKDVVIHNGNLIKDYIYTKDIAGAFVQFLFSDIIGCVNICTGQAISLREYASTIAKIIGKENFLHINHEETRQVPYVVGKNTKLTQEINYNIRYTLHNAISEILRGYNDTPMQIL